MSRTLAAILLLAIKAYRFVVSPFLVFVVGAGSGCRFTPTCSRYAEEALREHGLRRGVTLSVSRICRCHPWGSAGLDPVPPAESARPNLR